MTGEKPDKLFTVRGRLLRILFVNIPSLRDNQLSCG